MDTALDTVSKKKKKKKKTKIIAINVTSTASINCHDKKVKDCYILHTVLLVITLLPIIIICYHYVKKALMHWQYKSGK